MNNEPLKTVMDKILELQETILTAFVPEEAQTHFRSSRKEALLGIRALLDHTIKGMNEHQTKETKPEKHSSRIIAITEKL
jgi:hypothetical protein